MATSTSTSPARARNGTVPSTSAQGLRLRPGKRPRSAPWMVLGSFVVVASALAFAVTATHLGDRQPVLAVTRAVPAGAVIHAGDLRVVHISTDPTLHPVPGGRRAGVVGRTAAVPLAAGTLLTSSELGPPIGLGVGQASVGVALKSGQFPPDLAAGATVRVVDIGASPTGTASSSGSGATLAGQTVVDAATVTTLGQPGAAEVTVVGLIVPAVQANQVAALAGAGRVSLVSLPPQP